MNIINALLQTSLVGVGFSPNGEGANIDNGKTHVPWYTEEVFDAIDFLASICSSGVESLRILVKLKLCATDAPTGLAGGRPPHE